ncbi:MAG: Membrane-bound lytic murein transglycosylase precursor [Labilithrix sp.]|nr:Membrane-bound lytic murein transglycosylase precursor [Labilithrix sp.]
MRSRSFRLALPIVPFVGAILVARSAGAAPPTTGTTTASTKTPASAPASSAAATSAPKSAAPSSKPASSTNAKGGPTAKGHAPKSSTTSPRGPRLTENGVRRQVAGGPTFDDAALGADTPELRALAAAERELFPPSQRDLSSPWPQELPFPVAATEDKPRVHASGLPPSPLPSTAPLASESGKDLAWLAKLDMPDLPVRWDPRVVRYLEFFKDDPRGRATFTIWHRRSGRYVATIRKVLRKKSLPEDLASLAMIESGFDPGARSPVGALGLWQFMPETGKIYGLFQDRWADQRMSIAVATEAAADHLADLNRRFGSWELAMAAYNMGYGGVLQAVRRYNTNDYWALSKLEGSLPWETTLYVPKILAAAVVSKNLAAFGFQDLATEASLEGEEVLVAPGTPLSAVAQACGAATKDVELLNPELRASRTPPAQEDWPVKVPVGKAASCSSNLARARKSEPAVERYVVRFGESLEQIAQARKIPVAKIVELNGIAQGEVIRGGTVLVVPKGEAAAATSPVDPKKAADKPVVIVPQDVFVYPDRRRVFYRVQVADTIKDVCTAFKISPDELRRWNDIDPTARLVENMTLQIFVPTSADLSGTVVLGESDVRTIVAGTEEFFRHWDEKGRRRTVVTAKAGETLEMIGKRHSVSAALMERINRRGRSEVLAEGERVVVWTAGAGSPSSAEPADGATLAKTAPRAEPTPPLGTPPAPDLLPALP